METSFEKAVEYIYSIPRFTSKNPAEATKAMLELTGDISRTIPVVHVAGTNGKGSVCAYLRAGLEAAGYTTGMFTSPHLVDIRERFEYKGQMISEQEFTGSFETVMGYVHLLNEKKGFENYHPTFFEILFLMSMVWFAAKKPDVVIMEVGLGGRLDATNSMSSPEVSVITEIGLDHMEYLGATKDLIAGEKAGIIRDLTPVVFTDRGESWTEVIRKCAEDHGAETAVFNRANLKTFETSGEGIDFLYQSNYDNFISFSLKTKAFYQVENSVLAYLALKFLKEKTFPEMDLEVALKGFKNMKWPGRMEEILPGLVIDGSHNEDGIRAFLESVSEDHKGSRSLLYSGVSDKQIETVADLIVKSGLFNDIYVCELKSGRAAGLDRLKKAFSEAGNVSFYASTAEAFEAMSGASTSDIRYICGSLYLVGEIKELLRKQPEA